MITLKPISYVTSKPTTLGGLPASYRIAAYLAELPGGRPTQ
jgi:hypothetical protein